MQVEKNIAKGRKATRATLAVALSGAFVVTIAGIELIGLIFGHVPATALIESWKLQNDQAVYLFSGLFGLVFAFLLLWRPALRSSRQSGVFGVTARDVLRALVPWVFLTVWSVIAVLTLVPDDWRWPWG